MFAFVHKLKERPADVRNRIAIFTAISITAIIVGIWLLTTRGGSGKDEARSRSMSDDLKPLMMIFGGAKEGFQGMKTNISSDKE